MTSNSSRAFGRTPDIPLSVDANAAYPLDDLDVFRRSTSSGC